MAGVGLAADAVAAWTDPLGEALAAGVGWIIDHLGALKEWIQELTGNPGQVSAAAETWDSVAACLEECAQELTQSVTGRLAAQHSTAVDAYKSLQLDSASHLTMVAGLCRAVGAALGVASFLVNMVYEMVRDAISDLITKALSKTAAAAVTLGTATPFMVTSFIADVTQLVTRISRDVTDLVTSCRNLDDLMRQASSLLDELGDALRSIKSLMATNTTSTVAAAAARRNRPRTPRTSGSRGGGGTGGGRSGGKGGDGGGGKGGGGDDWSWNGGRDPNDASLSDAATQRAINAKDGLPDKTDYDKKTVSTDHVQTRSGWDPSLRPEGFTPPHDMESLAKGVEIGHPVRRAGGADHGTPGRYYASHAERQNAVQAEEPVIGVSKEACTDCQGFFGRLAQHEGRNWYVGDPSDRWIFHADGRPPTQEARPQKLLPSQ